jgi:GTP-binding protein YchF
MLVSGFVFLSFLPIFEPEGDFVLKIGIVGHSRVGKTTLFSILTHTPMEAFSGAKPQPRVGVATVPDERLDRLAKMYNPRKLVHAAVEYVDTPGSVIDLARAGLQGAALREAAALAHVLRAFGEGGSPDASRIQADIENVELELILSDLAVVEKRLERLEKDVKKQKNPALELELRAILVAKASLEKQIPLRELALDPAQERAVRGFTFLSQKPMLYVLNLDEKSAVETAHPEDLAARFGLKPRARTLATAVCGKVEAELAELNEAEASGFLASFGLKESAIARMVRSSYQLLGLISFFTVGEDECRAWTIRAGSTAWQAAGEIHSDIQKGFIRAECVRYDDLIAAGSLAEARARATLRLEGKEYVVKDGEIVHFRHSS